MDGLEATKKIKAEMPQTSVMMVTMHENPDYLFEAVKAGAAGYVLKDASGERLLGAVRRTLEGESPLNQELAMQLLVRLSTESSDGVRSEGGSPHSHPTGSEATQPEAHRAGSSGTRAFNRGGTDREPDAEGGRGVEAAQPGADKPPDRPEPGSQPRDHQDPRSAHNLQARSIRPHPGRRPRHRGRVTR